MDILLKIENFKMELIKWILSILNLSKKLLEKIEQRIKAVLDHGKYIMGPEVFELKKNWQIMLALNFASLVHLEQMHC